MLTLKIFVYIVVTFLFHFLSLAFFQTILEEILGAKLLASASRGQLGC
nr:photosystem II protein I [Halimeda borneensis]